MLPSDCTQLVTIENLENFPEDPYLRIRAVKGASTDLHRFLTTLKGVRGMCKWLTLLPSSRPVELTVQFNLVGNARTQSMESALDTMKDLRGMSTAFVSGLEPLLKGQELAGLMKSRIESIEELYARASTHMSSGSRWMNVENFRAALYEYSLGRNYVHWMSRYINDMGDEEYISFIGSRGFRWNEEHAVFMYAMIYCSLRCGLPEEARMTIRDAPHHNFKLENGPFYAGLIHLVHGTPIRALRSFILALYWQGGVHHVHPEADSLQAQVENNLDPLQNISLYYERLYELFQAYQGFSYIDADRLVFLSWFARRELGRDES